MSLKKKMPRANQKIPIEAAAVFPVCPANASATGTKTNATNTGMIFLVLTVGYNLGIAHRDKPTSLSEYLVGNCQRLFNLPAV